MSVDTQVQKINGFTRKLHPYQIISYCYFSGLVLTYFLIIFPLSNTTAKIVGIILEVTTGATILISGYQTTVTDPTDPEVTKAKKCRLENKPYEPKTREFYCGSDKAYVASSSKHCRRCGRCTEGFDHHCKWVNNDVGSSNYPSFFVLISSVMAFLIIYIALAVNLTIEYAKDHVLRFNDIYLYDDHPENIIAGMVIMWIFMAFSFVFLLLDTNLVLFHLFLIYKGLTTFQYIVAVEERKDYKKDSAQAAKILGAKKKTPLDFVLCLKKRKRPVTKNAPPAENQEKEVPKEVRIETQAPKQDGHTISENTNSLSSVNHNLFNAASHLKMAKLEQKPGQINMDEKQPSKELTNNTDLEAIPHRKFSEDKLFVTTKVDPTTPGEVSNNKNENQGEGEEDSSLDTLNVIIQEIPSDVNDIPDAIKDAGASASVSAKQSFAKTQELNIQKRNYFDSRAEAFTVESNGY